LTLCLSPFTAIFRRTPFLIGCIGDVGLTVAANFHIFGIITEVMLAPGDQIPDSIRQKITAALNGDTFAFGEVFQYFRPRLLSHAYRIFGNTPVAQDAVQDTFISAYTHMASLKDHAMFYPWLKKILVNNCYQLMRRDRSVELNEVVMQKEVFTTSSVQTNLEKITEQWQLFGSLRELSEELRICILLRYFTGLNSYDAIALVLGIPVGTVRSRLSAAREKLTFGFHKNADSTDAALIEGESWSGYYLELYRKFYDDLHARNELFDHHHKELNLRYTSGSSGKGRSLLENEVNNDLIFGSRFQPQEIISSGNISVIEGVNINHVRYPDRCAPMTTMVLFRKNDQIDTLHIFDSDRRK